MLQTLKNAWKIPELRKKLLFTLFILLIYRLGSVIPVPFIDVTTLANYFDSVLSSTILGLYNAMSGSAFSRATVLALGIQPYINASIIICATTLLRSPSSPPRASCPRWSSFWRSPPAPLWSCGWASRSRNSVSATVSP